MNEFRLWLNKEFVKKRREHMALLKHPDGEAAMHRLNELDDEMLNLQTALNHYIRFERVTGVLDEST